MTVVYYGAENVCQVIIHRESKCGSIVHVYHNYVHCIHVRT